MNNFLERLAVENSNKCNELGTEIEDLKREMFDLQSDYNIVVGKHNELADRIDKAINILEKDENKEPIEVILNNVGKALDILKGSDNNE